MKKKLFISLMAVFTVLVAVFIFVLIWFWGDTYEDFEDFKAEIEIPDLKSGATPQGLASYNFLVPDENGDFLSTTERQDYFFISAYFKKQPSRIYVVGKDTGYIGYVTLKNKNGGYYTGHCGGVAINDRALWVASGRKEAGKGDVLVYRAEDNANVVSTVITKAMNNGEIQFTSSFAANCNASFLFYYRADPKATSLSWADRLYVGEFYRAGKYETDKNHRVTTPAGDKNTAFVYEYEIDTSGGGDYGLKTLSDLSADKTVPEIQAIYSVTDEIQGFALTSDGKLVLSQSYGLKNSHLYYHDWNKVADNSNRRLYSSSSVAGKNFGYEGVTRSSGVPYTTSNLYVYFVDSSNLVRDYSVPSMSEGLCVTYENGAERVCVLFESGASKYKAFVRQILKEVYSFVPRKK